MQVVFASLSTYREQKSACNIIKCIPDFLTVHENEKQNHKYTKDASFLSSFHTVMKKKSNMKSSNGRKHYYIIII